MVVFIFEKPRSACDVIEKPRLISIRLMKIKCNSGASTTIVHCCDFDKTGEQFIQDVFDIGRHPPCVGVIGLRFYVIARPKYMEPP